MITFYWDESYEMLKTLSIHLTTGKDITLNLRFHSQKSIDMFIDSVRNEIFNFSTLSFKINDTFIQITANQIVTWCLE